jgi:integrase
MIEDEAFEAIVANLSPIYRPVVRLLRLSGMRKGEMCGPRWADIQRDRIALPDRPGFKTGRRYVPLTAAMRALPTPQRIDGSALVFEAEGGGSLYQGLGQAWDEARRKVGHPTLRLHDIRHTVATELDRLGDRARSSSRSE